MKIQKTSLREISLFIPEGKESVPRETRVSELLKCLLPVLRETMITYS
jgi:hypothetical protein